MRGYTGVFYDSLNEIKLKVSIFHVTDEYISLRISSSLILPPEIPDEDKKLLTFFLRNQTDHKSKSIYLHS